MAVSKGFIELDFIRMNAEEQQKKIDSFLNLMENRRSVRSFSNETVPEKVLENVIRSAGTSPSGANQQPWTFVLIKNQKIKKEIRIAAEREEKERLEQSSLEFKQENSVLGKKEYLEEAPYLIALFKINHGLETKEDGTTEKIKHYYVQESISICSGFLLSALENTGLNSLVHTPVEATQSILNRPENESPFLLIAVGYGKEDYQPPKLRRKPLSEIILNQPLQPARNTLAPPFQKTTFLRDNELIHRAENYYKFIKKRRNVRDYSTEPVDEQLLYKALQAAAATPSGGNLQPYRLVVVSDQRTKELIRGFAETEERKLYEEKISKEWKDALGPLGTGWKKPHLTDAPYLIVAFRKQVKLEEDSLIDGSVLIRKNSMALASSAMAVGVLICALRHAGLCTLTHTPSPMKFLGDLLDRPKDEVPFVVLPVGYPAKDCKVPDITKKDLSEILVKI
ncbi:nitroreductase family protein [Virgibacillus sp. DJP39]|uniref:nitroreductase family protein n=1 Tax=Virgibacillus sp. DJP39 TaxID=3409790 RepID=UPI003BB78115